MPCDRFERPRLFEEVRGTLDDDEIVFRSQCKRRLTIEFQYDAVVAADDQESRCAHPAQMETREIGTAAARNDGGNLIA